MTEEEFNAAFTTKRATTAAPDFAFSHTFVAEEGHIYDWGCFCTSMSPGSPMHVSTAVVGEVTTDETVPVIDGTNALWCGVLLALFAAVFMY